MKKILIILMFAFLWQTNAKAQCGVNTYQYVMSIEEKGIYLADKQIKSKSKKPVRFILNAGSKYGFFVLNPSKTLPTLEITDSDDNVVQAEIIFNESKNYRAYIWRVTKTGNYKLKANFGNDENACALLVLNFMGSEAYNKSVILN